MDESDDRERNGRITDFKRVGWVGWTLVVSASASIAAAAYNYGSSNQALETLKETQKEHAHACAEVHQAIQHLAIMAEESRQRILALERDRGWSK